jgi:hypothetical protein
MNFDLFDAYWESTGLLLDLSNLSELQSLHIPNNNCSLGEVHVNTNRIEDCDVDAHFFSAASASSFLDEIQGAPALSSLRLCSITQEPDMLTKAIPTLVHLKSLTLEWIDFGESVLFLPPTMTLLETLTLFEISMTTSGWRKLITNVFSLSQSVTVKLEHCKGPSKKEWIDIMTEIKPSTSQRHTNTKLNIFTFKTSGKVSLR